MGYKTVKEMRDFFTKYPEDSRVYFNPSYTHEISIDIWSADDTKQLDGMDV